MELLEIRNPDDLTTTYDQIEIQRGSVSTGSDMADIKTDLAINTATATDLTNGYSQYLDSTGTSAHYYRFRYKNSVSGAVSSYSEIFQSETSVMHTRFRNRFSDTNSASYYFTNLEIDDYLANAINKLFPHIYNEVIDETLTTLTDTEKYSFPVGVFRVNDIEYIDSSGHVVGLASSFKMRARQIIFDNEPSSGYTMRLYADKQFRKFAELPSQYDDLILDLMTLEAYQKFEADRSSYYKYTTIVNPEGGNMPSISKIIERLQITTERRINALRRTRRPSQIKLV